MRKKQIAMLGIILFAASLFPLNVPAIDFTPDNTRTHSWAKQKKHSKTNQGKLTSQGKPAKKRA